MDGMIDFYFWDDLGYLSGTTLVPEYGPYPLYGSQQVPPTPGEGQWVIWIGFTWALTNQPPIRPDPIITPEQVDAERDRRIAEGFIFDGVMYSTATQDQRNDIADMVAISLSAITLGGAQPGQMDWVQEGVPFAWAAADNTEIPMDAQTCHEFTMAASKRKMLFIGAAIRLKQQSPIPLDYASDFFWPPKQATSSAAKAQEEALAHSGDQTVD